MPRFKHVRTGSVVSVDDATAARLGTDYEPADKPAEKPRRRKAATKTDDE